MKLKNSTAPVLNSLLLITASACAPEARLDWQAASLEEASSACPAAGSEVAGPNATDQDVGVFGIGDAVKKAKSIGDAAAPAYRSDASKCGACAQQNTAEVYVTTKPRPSRYHCSMVGGPWKIEKFFSQQSRDCQGDVADQVQNWYAQTFQKGKSDEGNVAYQRCSDENCSFELAQSIDGPNLTSRSNRDCTASATAKVEYKCVDYRNGWDVYWDVRHSWTCTPKP